MVVRERRDVTDSARGKVFIRERRDTTDSAWGIEVGFKRLDVTVSARGMWSSGRDVKLQTVQVERGRSGEM